MKLIDINTIQAAMLQSVIDLAEESDHPSVVLDVVSLSMLGDDELSRVERWARQLSCPVIGLGLEDSSAAQCVDVVVESEKELTKILDNIAMFPQAATVLVQVLRTVEKLSPEDGLIVESLGYSTLQSGEEFKRWLSQNRVRQPSSPISESGPPVLLDRSADQLSIVLNRPKNKNAYSVEMRDALTEAFNLVDLDGSIKKVSITAMGRCFCTGGDLNEFGHVSTPVNGHMIRSKISPARLLLSSADRYHFHVHKACIGSGLELPAFAGYLTADPKTIFWLPELSMGLIPGAGGCVSISRRIGRQRTAYMVLTNRKIDAKKALDWGLVDAILPLDPVFV